MKKLRQQIKESFFNPVIYFLPLLIYIVMDEFYGRNVAWYMSFPVALFLLFYVYFAYRRIFGWAILFTAVYLGVGLVTGLEFLISDLPFAEVVFDEFVFLLFLAAFISFRKVFQRKVLRIMPRSIPMTNNFNELYRFVYRLFLVLLLYVVLSIVLNILKPNDLWYRQMVQYIYMGFLFFVTINEVLHVYIVRTKLLSEEWWPIVTDQGRVVGGVQHMVSLNDEKKYRHPVVRVLLIDKSMILLQKRTAKNTFAPGLWDTAISNHLQMGETIEQCVERTAKERYSISNFKYMFLTNYTIELEREKQYAFLFVSCQEVTPSIDYNFVETLKWWTQQQIEDNLNAGIFTENFKMEFELLKRSGLLETDKCDCTCKLKDAIYNNQPEETKDE